jgi:hypothetical protein
MRRWLVAAAAVALLAAGVPLLREWYLTHFRQLGPLEVVPAAVQVSVRVGESVRFSASADGAVGYTWLVWGRPVSFAPTWSYVGTPEEAGWQQVTVEVTGRGGLRAARTWDVGVVAAVVPVIEELAPAPGAVALSAGEKATFQARAHLPAARSSDRLAFEWTMDDRPVLREERPAADGVSQLVVPSPEPGSHRLRLRVTEDGRAASLADWSIDVRPGGRPEETAVTSAPEAVTPPAEIAAVPPPPEPVPPTPLLEPAPPAVVPRPILVRKPSARRLEQPLGEPLALEARVDPEDASVLYRWTVDGKPVREQRTRRFEFLPTGPGRHEVAVSVLAGEETLGRETWIVTVPAPPVAAEEAPETIASAPRIARTPAPPVPERRSNTGPDAAPVEAARAAPPHSLAEADVRSWLQEYARAWSRKDIGTLRRMGQVRSAAEAAQLERYFQSVDQLEVDVRVLVLRVDGERASVEFERTDTVTDPTGRRQQLRLPPMRKEIERTPEGLRFAERGGRG